MTSPFAYAAAPMPWFTPQVVVLVCFGFIACSGAAKEPVPPNGVKERSKAVRAPVLLVTADSIRVPAEVRAVVDAGDREAEDRKLDQGRRIAELLTFFGIESGMRVAELGAGRGYTAELLARLVGPSGKVFAQNSRFILERFAAKPWSERLKKPVMANVVRADREFDDPLPDEATELDAALLVLFYHDTVWMKTDRKRMNRAIFDHLRPGGVFAVVDHRARGGAGLSDVKTLHRIEEHLVIEEVENAGFVLEARSDLLQVAGDTYDWSASPGSAGERRGQSDRFTLRFRKPAL